MQTGRGFIYGLQKFRTLFAVTTAVAIAVPFVAIVSNLTPPSPPGMAAITGVIEVLALILVFHFLRKVSKKTIDHVFTVTVPAFFFSGAIYLTLFLYFTFEIPAANMRDVAGFICNADIPLPAQRECPFISPNHIAAAEYQAELLWLAWTVSAMRLMLALMWTATFLLLSTLIAAVLVYQRENVQSE